ncbi:hypothetical protein HAX54_052638, partial [Datura stramonium]|nr:hypothetical protein [Datura stramonium]
CVPLGNKKVCGGHHIDVPEGMGVKDGLKSNSERLGKARPRQPCSTKSFATR